MEIFVTVLPLQWRLAIANHRIGTSQFSIKADHISDHGGRVSSPPKPRVVIIGGGVAGLAAFMRLSSAFRVFRNHTREEFVCRWRLGDVEPRGLYHRTFDALPHRSRGLQSNPSVWREDRALTDHSIIYQPDPFLTCQYSGQRYCLSRNLTLLEEHLISLVSEGRYRRDSITCQGRQKVNAVHGRTRPPHGRPWSSLLNFALQMVPILPRFMHRSSLSVRQYLSSFTNRGIRELFPNVSDGYFSAVPSF
jgi:hypothetical protein